MKFLFDLLPVALFFVAFKIAGIYVAVSATNGCEYCTHSHTAAARKKGMTDAMLLELLAVTGLANETNRLSNGLRLDVDARFK